MGAFLGKRVVAPDTIVPVGEFEPKFAITTGRLTIEFASQMLIPPIGATTVVWSQAIVPFKLDLLPTLCRKHRRKQYPIVFILVSQNSEPKQKDHRMMVFIIT